MKLKILISIILCSFFVYFLFPRTHLSTGLSLSQERWDNAIKPPKSIFENVPMTKNPIEYFSKQSQVSSLPKDYGRDEFLYLLGKSWNSLATKRFLKKLNEFQLHEFPEILEKSADALGKIAEVIERNPSLERDGFVFYEKCASEKEFADSVRALCFSNYSAIGTKSRYSMPEGKIEPSIVHLAQSLDDSTTL